VTEVLENRLVACRNLVSVALGVEIRLRGDLLNPTLVRCRLPLKLLVELLLL
jgi:hypothetical protein